MDTSKPGRRCWNSTLLSVSNDLKTPGFSSGGFFIIIITIDYPPDGFNKKLQMMNSS